MYLCNSSTIIDTISLKVLGEQRMYELTKKDFELIEHAKKVIQANYDETNDRHTVGAAVRCKNGRIFTGVNLHSTEPAPNRLHWEQLSHTGKEILQLSLR